MMIKKLLAVLVAMAFTIAPAATMAQQQLPQGYTDNSRGFGRFNAVIYNQWKAVVASGNAATGAQTIQVQYGQYTLPDGAVFQPFATNAPITIGLGSNAETVTPTTVSGCNLGAGNPLPSLCNVTATFANTHGQGEPIFSGTFGLQEAINDAFLKGGGVVVIDKAFGLATINALPANTSLVNTLGLSNVLIEDLRGSAPTYWSPTPGLTRIATPTALTTASTITTATTGGTIATGAAVRLCVTAVDQFGGETACSDDSAGTAVTTTGAGATNSITITAAGVPVGTGIVGYRLYASAAAGTTQTETVALATNLTCGAAVQSPLAGTCGAGAAILLTSLPATTNAGPPPGTAGAATALSSAHTTVVNKQTGSMPTMLPFVDTAAAGFYPVTVTSATTLVVGFDVMGELQYPAGYFNTLGSTYRICGGGVTTPSAATVAGTWTLRIGNRQNSAGTSTAQVAVPWGMVASRQWTAAASHFDFCTDVTTNAVGTSGTVEGSGSNFCVVVAAGDDGAGVDTCVGAFNATSSAIDLTQQGVVQLTYVQSAASWTVPQLRYFSVRRL